MKWCFTKALEQTMEQEHLNSQCWAWGHAKQRDCNDKLAHYVLRFLFTCVDCTIFISDYMLLPYFSFGHAFIVYFSFPLQHADVGCYSYMLSTHFLLMFTLLLPCVSLVYK